MLFCYLYKLAISIKQEKRKVKVRLGQVLGHQTFVRATNWSIAVGREVQLRIQFNRRSGDIVNYFSQ